MGIFGRLLSRVSSRAPVWGASPIGQSVRGMQAGFKSCPRVGGILLSLLRFPKWLSFKSCPRVGGISSIQKSLQLPQSFKSCPRVGGIANFWRFLWFTFSFQVVPPCGGHHLQYRLKTPTLQFQVVPPCGGHRSRVFADEGKSRVSSRAPVWGASSNGVETMVEATGFKSCPRVGGIIQLLEPEILPKHVSSRAPVWGASNFWRFLWFTFSFQVVPPCGGHRLPGFCCLWYPQVSSRAPVWGASMANRY